MNCVKQRKERIFLKVASDNIDEVIALIKSSKVLKKREID
jgi:hypothetical protein